jgi:predicted DNA-binding transcriptional regulator AlpA
MEDRAIRLPEMLKLFGASRTKLWELERKDPDFPKRHVLSGGGHPYWMLFEALDYLRSRPTEGSFVPVAALAARGVKHPPAA